MTTITNKMTKQELANYLEETLSSDKHIFKDKSIVDMATYTLKKFLEDKAQVLKADLLDVAQEVAEYLMPSQQELKPVEAKLKPIAKKEEDVVEEKPVAKKKAGKKETVVEKLEARNIKLPETLDTDYGTYTLVTEGIDSPSDLEKAITEGRDIVLAVYWSKKLIKQFGYTGDPLFDDVKSFPQDYDVRKPVYFLENGKAFYALSVYTESMGIFREDDFEQVEGVRYTNRAEFGVYENLDVDPEEEVEELTQEYLDTDQVDEESVKELEEQEEQEESDIKEIKKVVKK